MADITIVQEHSLTPTQARAAAQRVADKMAQQYDLACQWQGDVLRFERSGVEGTLTLEQASAQLHIKLGFLFSAFSSSIESQVADNMVKVFGTRA
ncbi:MAG: polyhydroxyalkanoic acid system family protein [Pseudomonadota bacterium]